MSLLLTSVRVTKVCLTVDDIITSVRNRHREYRLSTELFES